MVLHFSNLAAQQCSNIRLCLDVIRTSVNRIVSAGDKRRTYCLQWISLWLGLWIWLEKDAKLQYQKVKVTVTVKPDVEAMSKARSMWRSVTRSGAKMLNIQRGKKYIRPWAAYGGCGDAWRQLLEDYMGGKRARRGWWKGLQTSQGKSNKTLLLFACWWHIWYEICWHKVNESDLFEQICTGTKSLFQISTLSHEAVAFLL